MAFGGLGTLFTLSGGILTPFDLALAQTGDALPANAGRPLFVQISDTHIGFNKEANPDVSATLKQTIELVNGMPATPALAIHTGDITHLSKPEEFDHASQLLSALRVPELHTVPGEHDVTDSSGAEYFGRFGKASDNRGYYSFDHAGVHFIGLVNVMHFKPNGASASATTSSRGSRRISRAARRARRSSCSRTCRCGPSTSRGAGAPATRRRRWRCCAASARSPY